MLLYKAQGANRFRGTLKTEQKEIASQSSHAQPTGETSMRLSESRGSALGLGGSSPDRRAGQERPKTRPVRLTEKERKPVDLKMAKWIARREKSKIIAPDRPRPEIK